MAFCWMSQADAAGKLGVSLTALKRACRTLGFDKWPRDVAPLTRERREVLLSAAPRCAKPQQLLGLQKPDGSTDTVTIKAEDEEPKGKPSTPITSWEPASRKGSAFTAHVSVAACNAQSVQSQAAGQTHPQLDLKTASTLVSSLSATPNLDPRLAALMATAHNLRGNSEASMGNSLPTDFPSSCPTPLLAPPLPVSTSALHSALPKAHAPSAPLGNLSEDHTPSAPLGNLPDALKQMQCWLTYQPVLVFSNCEPQALACPLGSLAALGNPNFRLA